MSAVTIAEAWPRPGEPFTVDDLERMPDDGHRYELIDGMLIVSPAPAMPHQRVAFFLGMLLEEACPAFELDGGSYAEVAHVTGGDRFRARKPFSVEIVPDRLVAKLPSGTAPWPRRTPADAR
jgi:Uma2 family endonuclease